MLAPLEAERRAVGSRTLVFLAAACGLVAWVSYEHTSSSDRAPALKLFVPPSGLQPVVVPGPQLAPVAAERAPWAQMRVPADPAEPMAAPSMMMPSSVDWVQMPPGQPFTERAQQAMPQVVMPSETDTFMGPLQLLFAGVAAGVAVGATVTKMLMSNIMQKSGDSNGAEDSLELGMLTNAYQPASLTFAGGNAYAVRYDPGMAGRAGVPSMMDAGASRRAEANLSHARAGAPTMMAARGAPAKKVVKKAPAKKVVKKAPARPVVRSSGSFSPESDIGVTPPLGLFDPLGFISRGPDAYRRYQEIEIKHGRLAMAATLGVIVTEAGVRFPGYISTSTDLKFSDVPGTLDGAYFGIPLLGWVQIVALIAALDIAVFRQDPNLPAGDVVQDLNINWVRYDDPEVRRFKLNVERNNGRAAMFGILGMISHVALGQDALFPIVGGIFPVGGIF